MDAVVSATIDENFNRTFNRSLITLVVPIALQNFISAAVISADVLMLGLMSQSAMAAVSLAGQVAFVLTLFYMGLATGVGILTSQYWGRKEIRAIQWILNISCLFSVAISVFFFFFSLCFSDMLMHVLTNDNILAGYGANFLRAVSFSYLAMGFSQMYFSAVKSMGNARLSALISSICLILNVALDALCIFVLFPGRPELAVTGVACSTVFARFTELGWCFIHSMTHGSVRFQLPGHQYLERDLLKDFLRYTLPVQANYIVWGGALVATAAIIGHVSADMVAANSIAAVVRNLAIVLCGGIASGGAVLVGNYLGNNEIQLAKRAGNRINLYALIFGALAGITILLLKSVVFDFVTLTPTAHGYLEGMLYICAYYCIGKSLNSTNIGGIFPAGGDPKFGFLCDTVVMWGIILPLSFVCAFVWRVPPVTLFAVINLDEVIKLPATLVRYRQYRWLKNLTREFAPVN